MIIKNKFKFSIILLTVFVMVLTSNMGLLRLVSNANDTIEITIKQYGEGIQELKLDWNGEMNIPIQQEQTIEIPKDDYDNLKPKVISTRDIVEYHFDKQNKTLYIFKLQNYLINYDTTGISLDEIQQITMQLEYERVTSTDEWGNLGENEIGFYDPSNRTSPGAVEEMNKKVLTIDKIDGVNITSGVTLKPDYSLLKLTGYGREIYLSNVNPYLTKLDVYTNAEQYDTEVEHISGNDYKIYFKPKQNEGPPQDDNPVPPPTENVPITVEFYGEDGKDGKIWFRGDLPAFSKDILSSNIVDHKTTIELEPSEIQNDKDLYYVNEDRTTSDPIVSYVFNDGRLHVSATEALKIDIEYINLTEEDLKNTSIRLDYWVEGSKRLPKTIIKEKPRYDGPSEGWLSRRPSIKEKITRDPVNENIFFTRETGQHLQDSDILTDMKLVHYIEPVSLPDMPSEVDYGTVSYGYKPYILSTSVNRENIEVSYNHQERKLTLRKKPKQTGTPLIPLQPAQPIIPLTPLQPAQPIPQQPLTPLTPAKRVIPLTPLTPAQPIPQQPHQPQQPNPGTSGGGGGTGGGGGNPQPKPKPSTPLTPLQPAPKPNPQPNKPEEREQPKQPKEKEQPKEKPNPNPNPNPNPQPNKPVQEQPPSQPLQPVTETPQEPGKTPDKAPNQVPNKTPEKTPNRTPNKTDTIDDNPTPGGKGKNDDESDEHNITKKNIPIKKSFEIHIKEDDDIEIISNPKHGNVKIIKGTGQFIYTPNKDYLGNDTFEIQINKEDGTKQVHLVTIDVFDEDVPKSTPQLPKTGSSAGLIESNMTLIGILMFIASIVLLVTQDTEKPKSTRKDNEDNSDEEDSMDDYELNI